MALSERRTDPAGREPERGGVGRWTRPRLALQVALSVLLAAVAAGLAPWLAERPGLHRRADLTVDDRSSLDPAVIDLLRRVPGDVTVEIFFRVPEEPWTAVGLEAQGRTRELLHLATQAAPTRLHVIEHDLDEVATVKERLRVLGLANQTAVNVVVVHSEGRTAVLRLFRDIAEVDVGNLDPRDPRSFVPPRLASFRAEEALAEALKKISVSERPKVYFSTGHGEPDLYGTEDGQLGKLHTLLVADGFEAEPWDPTERPDVPADAAVLALVDPAQPFTDAERGAILAWVERGGRVLAAPGPDSYDGPGGLADLVRAWGVLVQPGLVARPLVDPITGQLADQNPMCANLLIGAEGLAPRHPVTEPLYKFQRRVAIVRGAPLERGAVPEGGLLLDLVTAPQTTWRELPRPDGSYDFIFQQQSDPVGPFRLAVAATFPPVGAAPVGPPAQEPGGERAEARALVIGSPEALLQPTIDANQDFALNAFNWLAAREFRVSVRSRASEPTRLDLAGGATTTLNRAALFGLPGLCAALGLALVWRRRR